MDALVQKGYAKPAPAEETPNRTWYLPHFVVINPMKPDKLRVVHDATAKTHGVSLNDTLLKSPDLLQSLPGVVPNEVSTTHDSSNGGYNRDVYAGQIETSGPRRSPIPLEE
ncbi:unnamed protein product [Euphydryas editha]|uniref:Uncharacterized protein n=1 Tax=Euphydryas editha TaxID=104508 RepID=A0AAU9ULV0_EUPED|nr:unnamed protein product [Euphydryas editha]